MKAEHINPFVESSVNVFETMLGCKPERGEIRIADTNGGDRHDVTALIGLTGTAKGMVEVSFPGQTAVAISNRLAGTDCGEVDDSVTDALGEVVNMIAGGAKVSSRAMTFPSAFPQ